MSLVGLLGQLVQSAEALYRFWSCVKDVPAHLQWLSEDVEFLRSILIGITQKQTDSFDVEAAMEMQQALQKSATHLDNLVKLIAPLRPRARDAKCVVLWKCVKTVLSTHKIELFRANLEAAKSTLLLAQISQERSVLLFKQNGDLAVALTGPGEALNVFTPA